MSKSKELIVLLGGTSKAARTAARGTRAAEVLDSRSVKDTVVDHLVLVLHRMDRWCLHAASLFLT